MQGWIGHVSENRVLCHFDDSPSRTLLETCPCPCSLLNFTWLFPKKWKSCYKRKFIKQYIYIYISTVSKKYTLHASSYWLQTPAGLAICTQISKWIGMRMPVAHKSFLPIACQQFPTTWWTWMGLMWGCWNLVVHSTVCFKHGQFFWIARSYQLEIHIIYAYIFLCTYMLDVRKHCSMHICNLGLFMVLNAEGMTILGEHRAWRWGCTFQEAQDSIFGDFKQFCVANKIRCSQRRWKIHTVSSKGVPEYIFLVAKAFNARVILAFLSDT